jgi:hypothetical protein
MWVKNLYPFSLLELETREIRLTRLPAHESRRARGDPGEKGLVDSLGAGLEPRRSNEEHPLHPLSCFTPASTIVQLNKRLLRYLDSPLFILHKYPGEPVRRRAIGNLIK